MNFPAPQHMLERMGDFVPRFHFFVVAFIVRPINRDGWACGPKTRDPYSVPHGFLLSGEKID